MWNPDWGSGRPLKQINGYRVLGGRSGQGFATHRIQPSVTVEREPAGHAPTEVEDSSVFFICLGLYVAKDILCDVPSLGKMGGK